MRTTWTGGQYSVVRATFGLALGVAFAWSDGLWTDGLWSGGLVWMRALGTLAAIAFALGAAAPIAALTAAAAWIVLASPSSILAAPWTALVPIALALHALVPRAPFGSLPALGRVDPGGGWRLPDWWRWTAWILVLALAAAAEIHLGSNAADAASSALPRARLVACIAGLVPRLRPFAWMVLVGEEALVGFDPVHAHVLAARLLALGILFDPAWIPGRAGPIERVYYDGSCGLCHRAVRFLLAEDPDGSRFRFAPLHGDAFTEHVPQSQRTSLPDTVIVQRADGSLAMRSDAALHLLERAGGVWRVLGVLGGVIPRGIRDAAYAAVARVRKRLFAAPKDACPLLPAGLRARFET